MRKAKPNIPRINDNSTVKVIILFLLNELDCALNFRTLTQIILWDERVNYFVFADCLHDLSVKGALTKGVEDGEEVYSINDFGRQILESVSDTLLATMKRSLMRSATRVLAFNRTGSVISTKATPDGEGLQVQCLIQDRQHKLLDLQVYVDSEDEAFVFQKRFDEKAEHIYRSILALLSGEVKLLE